MSASEWTVTLSPGECLIAATVAANRQVANREANVLNLQGGPQSKMTTELIGIYGELAIAKMLNCYPDMTTHLRSGGADLVIGNLTVDVKSTRSPIGDLRIDARPGKVADVYVLAQCDWTTVTAIGFASSADLTKLYATPGGGGWTIPRRALRSMDLLKRLHAGGA